MKVYKNRLLTISLLSIPLSAGVALVPVLSDIAHAFPDQQKYIQLLITLPSLFMMFSSFVTDKISKISSLKFVSLVSVLIIMFAGVSPFWINSFGYLLFTRVLMGLGLGLLNTVMGSLPAIYFEENSKRDFAIGFQSAFVCIGGILFNILSGFFAKYKWQFVFLVQLINVIPLLTAVLIMPKIKPLHSTKTKKSKIFVKNAMSISIISFLIIIITCTYPLNISMFVKSQNLGTSQFVGVLTSVNSAIGFIIGLIFGKIFKILKEQLLTLGLFLSAIALLIAAFAPNQIIFLFGNICFGIGTSFISPSLYSMLYKRVEPTEIVSSVALLGVFSNISQFVSPFIINPLSKILNEVGAEKSRFIISSILAFLMIISLNLNINKKSMKSSL